MTLFERKKTNGVLVMIIRTRNKYMTLRNTEIVSVLAVKLLKDIYVYYTAKNI